MRLYPTYRRIECLESPAVVLQPAHSAQSPHSGRFVNPRMAALIPPLCPLVLSRSERRNFAITMFAARKIFLLKYFLQQPCLISTVVPLFLPRERRAPGPLPCRTGSWNTSIGFEAISPFQEEKAVPHQKPQYGRRRFAFFRIASMSICYRTWLNTYGQHGSFPFPLGVP